MRKIRTSNNYCEFIEADDNGQILTSRGFQFGELYFQIKNGKVTFYLNDQENPWRNDVWTINIPFELDGVQYDTEDAASAALHNIMNDRFQEQLDELNEELAGEEARAQAAEEALGEEIDDERDRATSAETHLQTEVTELSGTVATFDNRITTNTNAISALTDVVNGEIARSTGKDAEHDAQISGLTNTLNSEIQRALSAETTLHNDITSERDRAIAAESALTNNLNVEILRSTGKDSEHDTAISGLTSDLSTEISNRTNADNTLQNNLTNEVNRAVSADTELHNEIVAERDRAIAAESGITANLNAEISARTSADAEELQRIASLETGKADAADVYTKTESDNKYATKDYLSGLTENIYTKGEVNTLLNDKADKVSAVSSAMYNSQSKTIDFKNISGTVISSIDARDFIKDGMVDNVAISGSNLVITFNTDAGKEPISIALTDIFDPSNYYNKTEIDAALSGKASTGDVATISGDVQTLSGEVQTISGSAITSGEVQTLIDNSISGKTIDYLSAGTNVQINNNVISATDTKYTAGSGITISGADNKITLDANIYKGSGSLSVSLNNPNGSSSSYNQINGNTSIGAGYMIKTTNVDEAAFGISNISTYGNTQTFNHSSASTLFSVGNGNYNDRHNAIEIKQNGDIYIADTSATGLAYNYPMIKLQDALVGGVTSGDVQTMIDESISGKVNVVDNEVPDYYVSGTSEYTRYFPSQSEHATYANGLTTLNAVGSLGFGSDSVWHTTIEIINEQGQTISGSCNLYVNDVNNTSIVPTALTNYMTATVDKTAPGSTVAVYTLEDGWKISWVNMYTDRDYDIPTMGMTITNSYVSKIYDGGQSEYVIENVIEPELVRLDSEKQNKLSAGTNITISGNVISSKDTTYTAGHGISITNSQIEFNIPLSAGTGNFSTKENDATNVANGYYSKSVGLGVTTNNINETALGRYNLSTPHPDGTNVFSSTESGATLFSVGNGFSDATKHNALEIKQNGDIYISSGGTDIKLQDHLGGGGGGIEYSAGTNVQINNHVISATDTKYTAGDNISINNNNVISTVTKFWCGTEQEWGQISGGTLDVNTIYMVH